MRVFLDAGADVTAATASAIRDACGMARDEGVADLWVAFERGGAPAMDLLRRVCEEHVDGDNIVSYELPPAAPAVRRAIRAQFFEARGADQVRVGPRWLEAVGVEQRPPRGRPRVAFVAQLPPARSGVAFHAAELAIHLATVFDMEIVTPQPQGPGGMVRRSPEWFAAHAADFDAVIYHVGNSRDHEFALDLMEAHPGIVVLHDVYLGNLMDELGRTSRPHALARAAFASHGWPALALLKAEGREAVVWRYPASFAILERATRVIVHSRHARAEIARWWGDALAERCEVVPLLRERGEPVARDDARRRLGIGPDEFVVCSFGLLGPTKCNAELLDAFLASPLACDARCRLVYVGENVPNAHGAALAARIASHGAAASVAVTGFVDDEAYRTWLAAADLAVQLRTRSRGETSAAVLDCLANGVPTIVNAHGSTADIDDALLAKVPDAFTTAELAGAIERWRGDAAGRARLGAAAAAEVRQRHGRDAVVRAYAHAVAEAQRSPVASALALAKTVAGATSDASPDDLARIAAAAVANQPAVGPRQLLVDVSALAQTDLGTGIQRVVKQLLREWFVRPPAGWRVEPVYSTGSGRAWRYARRFAAQLVGLPRLRMEETLVEARAGDCFLGLDLHTALAAENEAQLLAMREQGVRIVYALYDLLPVRMPAAFPPGTTEFFERWLHTIARVSDGVVAISRASADDFAQWLDEHPPPREWPLALGHFDLGADIGAGARRPGWFARRAVRAATARPALLMVGTLEPRKGHRQALDAMEALWRRGVDLNLVIVGKAGWMMDDLVERLRRHPERRRRLFWFGHAPDALLGELYAASTAVLAASEGEGYGLPLVEAAQHGLPIIARDLPVFREVAGDHAFFFRASNGEALATAIEAWLALHARGEHPGSQGLAGVTWERSARSLEAVVLGGRWFRRWSR